MVYKSVQNYKKERNITHINKKKTTFTRKKKD